MKDHNFLLCLIAFSYLSFGVMTGKSALTCCHIDQKKTPKVDSTRDTESPDLDPNVYQGDIIVSADELERLKQNNTTPSYRNAIKDADFLWPQNRIYYIISKKFNKAQLDIISNAMKRIHHETCLTFWDAHKYPPTHGHKIYIYLGTSCHSWIGFQKDNPEVEDGCQELSLGPKCFKHTGYAEHELLHAIGLYHEQSRTDRNDYVEIIWKNIRKDQLFQFYLYRNTTTYNQAYDYGSVMHYRRVTWAKIKGTKTMLAKQDNRICLGNRHHATQCDLEKVRHMYGCPIRNNCVPLVQYEQNGFCND